jgi:hypothetical protein
MLRVVAMSALIGAGLLAGPARAADETGEAPPKCETAEINPVTGHVFCIKPRGAPVEAPPQAMKPACKPEESGQWSWGPACEPAPGEM